MKGCTGKILFVDLSSGTFEEQNIEDNVYEEYLAGVGLAANVLYKNIPANADPLGPDNVLGFTSGLLTGTGSVMTGRWMVVGKSPLTGGWGDANCGGTFSPAIKQCGYDAIFFKGISDKPVYLFIDNKGLQLKDASHIWGKDAVESEDILEKENWKRKKPCVAVIGQAGENCSLISGISNDRGRMAARSGLGAVMGSKKLKAVVLAGSKLISCENPQMMKELSKEYCDKVRVGNLPDQVTGNLLLNMTLQNKSEYVTASDGIMATGGLKKWGTSLTNQLGVEEGDTPVKNWSGSVVDYNNSKHEKINPDLVIEREYKKYHCYSCVIGCGGVCQIKDVKDGKYKYTHKPEYETWGAFGPLLLNDDLESIFYINEILNRAGMDTISAGTTVAFAIECYENDILTKADLDGLDLNWGNSKAIIELIEKMITRNGIGDILADGVKVAASKIGKGSEKFAIHAGGQEPAMHDSRHDPGYGIHYSVEPTPGRHTIGSNTEYKSYNLWQKVSWAPKVTKYLKDEEYIPSDKEALKAVANSCFKMVVDGTGGCYFAMMTGVQHWKLFEMINAATGWSKSPDEYMEIGRRIQTLRQMFNVKQGIDPISFKMHDRMTGNPPLTEGSIAGKKVPIEDMMKLYWKKIGWDEKTGIPKKETIQELFKDVI